jgi:hypothetical protein
MRSKVFSDWRPSYIKAARPVLEIFKMAEYFPDSPRMSDTKKFTTFESENLKGRHTILNGCWDGVVLVLNIK